MRNDNQTPDHPSLDLVHAADIINFYSSADQRQRGVRALDHTRSTGLVLASSRIDSIPYSAELRESGINILNISRVEISADWRRSISQILDAALHSQQEYKRVQVLADFDGLVHYAAVYELESLLRAATKRWNVRCITQYDARKFSEAINVDALSKFGIVMIGSYYQKSFAARQNVQTQASKDSRDSAQGD